MAYPSGRVHHWHSLGLGLSNGAAVGTVPDLIGSADLTEATNKPTFVTGELAGNPAISHDGTNDKLTSPSISAISAGTILIVAKSGNSSQAYFLDAADGVHAIIQGFTSGKWEYYNSPRTVIGDISTSDYQIIVSDDFLSSTGAWKIGGWTGGDAFWWAGKWIAIIIWDRVLDSTEITAAIAQANTDYFTATPDATPPSDVTGLTGTVPSATQINLDWDNATDTDSGISDYNVYRNTSNSHSGQNTSAVGSNTSAKNITGLTPGEDYYFWIKAKNGSDLLSDNYSSVLQKSTPPRIDTNSPLNNVIVGQSFSQTLAKTSAKSGTWSIESGAPDGMTIDSSTGEITWNPDTLGEVDNIVIRFTVISSGLYAEKTFSITVIDSIVAQYFEKLEICKIFNITSLGLDMPLLSADFGDGYGAGVLSGKSSGLRLWAITAELLPDLSEYSLSYTVDEVPETATYFQYFWDFFKRHIAHGNKPFYFTDPRTNRKFLASFTEPRLSFEAFTAKLYSGGVQIKQRRAKVEDLTFRDEDGSINE